MDPVLPVLPPLRQLVLPLEAADPSPRLVLRGPRSGGPESGLRGLG